jgi:hypothetical protein
MNDFRLLLVSRHHNFLRRTDSSFVAIAQQLAKRSNTGTLGGFDRPVAEMAKNNFLNNTELSSEEQFQAFKHTSRALIHTQTSFQVRCFPPNSTETHPRPSNSTKLSASRDYHPIRSVWNMWSAVAAGHDSALSVARRARGAKAPSPLRSAGALHMAAVSRGTPPSLLSISELHSCHTSIINQICACWFPLRC